MGEVAFVSVAVLWVVAVVELVRIRRGTGTPSLAVAVVALAVGRTLDLDEVGAALGRTALLGVLEHAATLTSALGVLAFTGAITSAGTGSATRVQKAATDPRVWIVLAAAIAAPLMHPTEELPASAAERAVTYANDPLWWLHWAAFLGVLALVLWHGAGISLRNVRHVDGVLRARLVGLGLGQTMGVVYAVLKGVLLVVLALAPPVDTDALSAAEQAALTLCIAAIAVGLLVGALSTAWTSVRTRVHVWALWPLWRGLWDHAPHLLHARTPGRLSAALARDVDVIAVRQVVELSDAARALGPHMPEHDHTDPGAHARALAEASARRLAGLAPMRSTEAGVEWPGVAGAQAGRLLPVARHWSQRTAHQLEEEYKPAPSRA